MENQIKTPFVLIGLVSLAALLSSCGSTVPVARRAEALPASLVPQMHLSVAQAPRIGYVFCETDACPKPTPKSLPVAKSATAPSLETIESPTPSSDIKVHERSLDIQFPFDKATISATDRALIQKSLTQVNPTFIRIVGRSDFVGPPPAQTRLASHRAEVLRQALSSTSSSSRIAVETEVAAPNRVNASEQAHQRRGSVFFVR